ncbi:hypothetical protein H5410_012162 [Solanum commersonii]|uniref:Uncharacterized protein n=1 Tax=Solanum commersonii TaxID=4109 RepID=A0A9J6AQM4_SOLCO|nr:hypothetical protein H5410_012162 [Solanum commersonii]
MEHPSFSIGITQIVTANTNRISDYEDPNGAKNMSNRLHDPITMAKQSSKKSKAKNEAHAKTPKKRVERLPRPYPYLHYQRDCEMFFVVFVEFLSGESNIPSNDF